MVGNDLVGKTVYIKTGWCSGQWGVVKLFDGEYYHVSPWGDDSVALVFYRNEIRVPKSTSKKV